jgi:3-isopropylmalate dehydrogenase
MTRFSLAVLPGDGIGPEVTTEAVKVLRAAADLFGYRIDTAEYAVGAAGVAESGDALPERTRSAVIEADAVLLGAVGHPDLAGAEGRRRPEAGLLALRKLLGVYANLRPVAVHPSLVHASPLRPDRLAGVDLLIVRELTGGLYYGEPRSLGQGHAVNTLSYTVPEIERVARVGFRAAVERRGRLTSVDKANVLEVSQLWRETVSRVGAAEFPEVALEHLYVDFAAMRLVAEPARIDVLLTENLFGDILGAGSPIRSAPSPARRCCSATACGCRKRPPRWTRPSPRSWRQARARRTSRGPESRPLEPGRSATRSPGWCFGERRWSRSSIPELW